MTPELVLALVALVNALGSAAAIVITAYGHTQIPRSESRSVGDGTNTSQVGAQNVLRVSDVLPVE